jgi:hypothetical protein
MSSYQHPRERNNHNGQEEDSLVLNTHMKYKHNKTTGHSDYSEKNQDTTPSRFSSLKGMSPEKKPMFLGPKNVSFALGNKKTSSTTTTTPTSSFTKQRGISRHDIRSIREHPQKNRESYMPTTPTTPTATPTTTIPHSPSHFPSLSQRKQQSSRHTQAHTQAHQFLSVAKTGQQKYQEEQRNQQEERHKQYHNNNILTLSKNDLSKNATILEKELHTISKKKKYTSYQDKQYEHQRNKDMIEEMRQTMEDEEFRDWLEESGFKQYYYSSNYDSYDDDRYGEEYGYNDFDQYDAGHYDDADRNDTYNDYY